MELVGRYDPQKIAESVLIAQIPGSGAVADLRDVEELQKVLHLNADGARSGPNHSHENLAVAVIPTLLIIHHPNCAIPVLIT